MRDRLDKWRKALGSTVDAAWERLPDLTITSDVEVPVYVIHHGPDPEDYELVCDFEAFMRESQTGLLHRPVLRVWAGRDDFERMQFARHLREAFSHQFDLVRQARREEERKSWLPELPTLAEMLLWGVSTTGGLIGSVLLYLAAVTGGEAVREIGRVLRNSLIGRALRGKDPESALEEVLAQKRTVIDAALARQTITLHRDLYAHAWRGQRPGPMTGMDRDAWPLPGFVTNRMDR